MCDCFSYKLFATVSFHGDKFKSLVPCDEIAANVVSNFEAKECNEFRCEQAGVSCVNWFLPAVIVPCYAFTHSLSIHSLCGAELFFLWVEQSGPISLYIADKLCIR